MNADKHRVETLYYAALKIADPRQRELFLEQSCVGDEELKAQTEAMLSAQEEMDWFFDQSLSALALSAKDLQAISQEDLFCGENLLDEEVGTQIGHYRLLQKLGEGGGGAVYLAEQSEPVERQVALKIIKLGMDTKRVIARFNAERKALGLMEHPNIARVFDAGATGTGRPYFVMELVRGAKITEFCDMHRLEIRQRLELFGQVCHAIQHAHQKGIIHRDIKPSNVLVSLQDGTPVPRVIDFGISKATEEPLTDLTRFSAQEQILGTPAYMSPEQLEQGRDVDTRSDVYSLGVLLYELLTGMPPFDPKELLGNGVEQLRRTLLETLPLGPSSKLDCLGPQERAEIASRRGVDPAKLRSQLKGDLDWIVMKSLEKERARRYETAESLRNDIERHLKDEPVVARPPSRLYLLGKLVQRNKATFGVAAGVVLALVIGIGFSTWGFLTQRVALQRAVSAEQRANRLLAQAADRQKLSQATIALSRSQYQEADRLIAGIPAPEPNLEYAELYRALGEWHAAMANWKDAAARFAVLIHVNQPEDWDSATMDYLRFGPLPVELGDLAGYERFRKEIVARYAGTEKPLLAERVLKISLLIPSGDNLRAGLESLTRVASRGPFTTGNADTWRAFSVALGEYRMGHFTSAQSWCERSAIAGDWIPGRAANVKVLQAMIHFRMDQRDLALTELAEANSRIEAQFSHWQNMNGYWFDWLYARILLREAAREIQNGTAAF